MARTVATRSLGWVLMLGSSEHRQPRSRGQGSGVSLGESAARFWTFVTVLALIVGRLVINGMFVGHRIQNLLAFTLLVVVA